MDAHGSVRTVRRRAGGFTLLELVIVMAMLVLVLMTAYQILNNCLQTERHVERLTVPEKVGEGIISLLRRDLGGIFYRGLTEQLDRQVFLGRTSDSGEGHMDDLRFLTTVPPTRQREPGSYQDDIDSLQTITVIGYHLEPNPDIRTYRTYRLYRRELSDLNVLNPLESGGLNLEVYDKVKSFNVEYYDGYEWLVEWDSRVQIEAQTQMMISEAQLRAQGQDQVAQLNTPRGATAANTSRAGAAATAQGSEGLARPAILPPAAIPSAIRIELEIYGGTGNEIHEVEGQPVVRRFRTIVPILAAVRIPLQLDQAAELAGGAASDDPMAEAGGGGVAGPLSGSGAGGRRGGGGRGDAAGGPVRTQTGRRGLPPGSGGPAPPGGGGGRR